MANAVNQEDRSRFACKICARLVADPVMIADGPRLALESLLRLSDRLTAESQETGAKASTETVAPHLHPMCFARRPFSVIAVKCRTPRNRLLFARWRSRADDGACRLRRPCSCAHVHTDHSVNDVF